MRRLNVQTSQLEACVDRSMFAVERRPNLEPVEPLLLQLTKSDAETTGKLHRRIEHVLEFDHLEPDPDGSVSRANWPDAGRTWSWILYGRRTLPTEGFSLEDLPLSRSYAGPTNPNRIDPVDEAIILPYILGSPAAHAVTPAHDGYASPVDSVEVDEVRMDIAMGEVRAAFPGERVMRMPHNNPGFDILVEDRSAPVRYIEVKSTRSPEPVFNMSEGERRFSAAHADRYTLLVIAGVELSARTHQTVHWYSGEVAAERFNLRPMQWRGRGPDEA